MAFNLAFETRRRVTVRPVVTENESSLFSESQSLWVVFNPVEKVENDILSLSTTNSFATQTEDEEDTREENDDLIDALEMTLSHKIDQWQHSTDAAVSDNIASWDLDEELVSLLLDKSILRRVPAYYGDHYFENMSKADYVRFKRASNILKQSLTGNIAPDKDLISRVIELLQWQNLLRTSGSLVNDYIANTLARTNHMQGPLFRDVEFSDTATSSSFIMCGGSSWNDI